MILRGVLIALVGALVGACGSASPSPDQVAVAWKAALVSDNCPKRHMITADRRWLKFLVSGCGVIEQVQMQCEEQRCSREVLSSTRLAQPRRLRTTDGMTWTDPGLPELTSETVAMQPARASGSTDQKTVNPGQRLSDINSAPHKPTLPMEMNRAGMVVWGIYKVCVNRQGDVQTVSVLKSALPGGLDGAWISRIETWKYAPYVVDGKPTPFCHPARIEVRSVS